MTPGTISFGEPGAMVSAGLDAKGTAHTILVDPTGRVITTCNTDSDWAPAAVAIVFLIGLFAFLIVTVATRTK